MDQQQMVAEARALTGELNRPTRRQYPTIKFMGRGSKHGAAGTYHVLRKAKDGDGLDANLIGDTAEVTFLKIRSAYDNGIVKPRKWVSEYDTVKDGLSLRIEGSREPVELTYQELKEQHPDLKYHQVVYVFYGGEVCKMKVSGSSLSELWKYLDSFADNETFMQFKTILGAEERPHDAGNYHVMTFTRGEPDAKFGEYLGAIKSIAFPKAPAALSAPTEPAASASEFKGDDEEINVEDIPF